MDSSKDSLDIAIIGLSGRFPGAETIEKFWRNIRDGVESITFFTDEELTAMGVNPAHLLDPNFIKAGSILEGVDLFDAKFFGYSPKEAALIDPQHRIFLECAWEASENAGYHPDSYQRLIGVYAGTSLSTYLLYNLLRHPVSADVDNGLEIMIGNDKDFLSTRVSYELNLRGPSLDVQTGCSTSLVAVHLACQSLLNYQCDMALAGGVSIQVPQRTGYYRQSGSVYSPDGHCRPFDANAAGTIFGSGVGIVVLKRLVEAVADGDYIYAVIKASAVNNDGYSKIGFTAPSVEGQAQVVAMTQMLAGVEPETVGYIEAHGTGTALGDPIEMAALTKVFRAATNKKRFCAIGSVKSNIGHLDAAAGVAGLIKTVLALKHKQLPPSLNFNEPNPKIDFANSPFYVNTKLSEWKSKGSRRRAGISSFGIGGTNAHVILEEAPAAEPSGPSRPLQLMLYSVKTPTALEPATRNLIEYLNNNRDANLADIAFTLQVSRSFHDYGRMLLCRDIDEAIKILEARDPQRLIATFRESIRRSVIFMFPGGGAQYAGMGAEFYRTEQIFREQVDFCLQQLKSQLGYDLWEVFHADRQASQKYPEEISQVSVALPYLFVVEYALAKLWMSWGVQPEAMIGHSIGEYTAACLAGVFSLEDALFLVVARSRLIERLSNGAMLSIPLAENGVRRLMDGSLAIAAINSPSQCVVSGASDDIERFSELLLENEIEFRRLRINAAGHSNIVLPIIDEFIKILEQVKFNLPTIPYISNVTGTWITKEQATDPGYYADHLRSTVRFSAGIETLLKEPVIMLEAGPGQTLSSLVRSHLNNQSPHLILPSMRRQQDRQSETEVLLTALGKLRLAGLPINWERFYENERRRRLPLPTYPFERQRYWVEPKNFTDYFANQKSETNKISDVSRWFYVPSWKRSVPLSRLAPADSNHQKDIWLIFIDNGEFCQRLVDRLKAKCRLVITVERGEGFERVERTRFVINPAVNAGYARLIDDLIGDKIEPTGVIHLWSLSQPRFSSDLDSFDVCQESGFYSLLYFAQAVGEIEPEEPIHLWIITDNAQAVESRDLLYPEKVTIMGAGRVIPQENQYLKSHFIDLSLGEPSSSDQADIADLIIKELDTFSEDSVAYRGIYRWIQTFEPVQLEPMVKSPEILRNKGVYLITGGLGRIGLQLAEHLARSVKARILLVGRSSFPERSKWAAWVATHEEDNEISLKINRLLNIEAIGSEVLVVKGDTADKLQMLRTGMDAVARFGAIHGVIHTAGITGEKAVKLIPELDRDHAETIFRAKAQGLYVIRDLVREVNPDFCLLFSSNAAILGGIGSAAYSAANMFMDAFAIKIASESNALWMSIDWDGWLGQENDQTVSGFRTSMDQYAMKPSESLDAFNRILSRSVSGQIIVSTGDLQSRMKLWVKLDTGKDHVHLADDCLGTAPAGARQANCIYTAPTNETERMVAGVWEELLGIDQVGIDDNFFDLGGNSLIGLKLIAQLKRKLNLDIPIIKLFEGPTIRTFVRLIEAESAPPVSNSDNEYRGGRRRKRYRQKKATA